MTAPRLYIIIVGGGKVGFHLAKELVESNYEVLVIELDPAQANAVAEELGDIVLEGDGCEASVHEKAGTRRANMVRKSAKSSGSCSLISSPVVV